MRFLQFDQFLSSIITLLLASPKRVSLNCILELRNCGFSLPVGLVERLAGYTLCHLMRHHEGFMVPRTGTLMFLRDTGPSSLRTVQFCITNAAGVVLRSPSAEQGFSNVLA